MTTNLQNRSKLRRTIRNYQSVLLLALLMLSAFAPKANAQRRERLIDTWRPVHYDVALSFNDELSEITKARTEITLRVLKRNVATIDFDFGEMPIDSVTLDEGNPARYERGNGLLRVSLAHAAKKDEQLKIVVSYHGRPKDGLILTMDKDGRASATGDNWPDRVHHWIPCLDHPSAKATVNFTVTAPARDMVVANGQFEGGGTTNSNGATMWVYTEGAPIPPYCMVIAVGEYAKLAPTVATITPLSYYVPPSDRAFAVQGFSPAPQALSLFSETIAPYPYEKLALIVGATRFGGMENSSAIVFTSTLFNAQENAAISMRYGIRQGIVDVVAHEIAHQWFGDSVTEATWSDLWLSEGFATYFAGLFLQRFEGESVFRDYMRRNAETYFRYERERRAPIHDTETTDLFKLLNANNYQKGAWVLHMLRHTLGDAAFFRGLRNYYDAHRNSIATTEDLRAALEKSSGMNLKEFFARWIYQSGHPRYSARWTVRQFGRNRVVLTIQLRQLQDEAPFLNSLPVEIVTASGTTRTVIKPLQRETIVRIPLSSRLLAVRIDPDETVLKELVVQSPR